MPDPKDPAGEVAALVAPLYDLVGQALASLRKGGLLSDAELDNTFERLMQAHARHPTTQHLLMQLRALIKS